MYIFNLGSIFCYDVILKTYESKDTGEKKIKLNSTRGYLQIYFYCALTTTF